MKYTATKEKKHRYLEQEINRDKRKHVIRKNYCHAYVKFADLRVGKFKTTNEGEYIARVRTCFETNVIASSHRARVYHWTEV